MFYESIASPIRFPYTEKLLDHPVKPKIHWHKLRKEAMKMWLNRDSISDDIGDFTSYLYRYVMLPAVEDSFTKDTERDKWAELQNHTVQRFYQLNRLRVNNISTVLMGIPEISRIISVKRPIIAVKLKVISSDLWRKFNAEDRSKISLKFSDLVAEKSLESIKLLNSPFD